MTNLDNTNIMEKCKLLEKARWKYARTYPNAPHEYTLLEWNNKKDMIEFAQIIQEQGHTEYFYKKKFTVLFIDKYRYWSMDLSVENTALINRAFIDDNLTQQVREFVKSDEFIYVKDMSLNDILEQIEKQDVKKRETKLEKPRTDEEMKEAYKKAYDYDPTDKEVDELHDDEFNAWIDSDEL